MAFKTPQPDLCQRVRKSLTLLLINCRSNQTPKNQILVQITYDLDTLCEDHVQITYIYI